ncbi:MAG: hypothetical protein KC931_08915, partial [Candidatus Omnitrophica bacterium]|nr:hypothetical protein [Candidatus Omnitrophota bacterium]
MSRSWCAWILSGLLLLHLPSFAYKLSHQDPVDFAAGVLDGKLEIPNDGGIELGSGRLHHQRKTRQSTELHTPSFTGFLGIPLSELTNSEKGMWHSPIEQRLGRGSFKFTPPTSAEVPDGEWFEGNLHVLMKPSASPPTSTHLYRMRMKPNGQIGGPELYALAPPGTVLSRLTKVEDRLFAVARNAGESAYHLLELKNLGPRTGGWVDFGDAPVNEYSAWDLSSSGETLVILSPQSRQVAHARLPEINSLADWEKTSLGGGEWGTAMSRLLESFENRRDNSALVFNEFSLPEKGSLGCLALETEGSSLPRLRYRVAQAEDDWFGDWTEPGMSRVYPIEGPGKVVQYQLIQPVNSKPSKVSEVKIEWSLQDSPPTKRWHFTEAQPAEEKEKLSGIEKLFRKNWKTWKRPGAPSQSPFARAGSLAAKAGSRLEEGSPIGTAIEPSVEPESKIPEMANNRPGDSTPDIAKALQQPVENSEKDAPSSDDSSNSNDSTPSQSPTSDGEPESHSESMTPAESAKE